MSPAALAEQRCLPEQGGTESTELPVLRQRLGALSHFPLSEKGLAAAGQEATEALKE